MAKQFSILATDVDLQEFRQLLEALGDVDILSDVATENLQDLRPLGLLELPVSRVGKDSLFCYLAPRHLPRRVVAERDSPVKVHIDVNESHLIEFWRPFYDGQILREGRLYYQNKVLLHDQLVEKHQAFRGWADRVMTAVRKTLKLQKELGAYVAAHAAAELASGKVTVAS